MPLQCLNELTLECMCFSYAVFFFPYMNIYIYIYINIHINIYTYMRVCAHLKGCAGCLVVFLFLRNLAVVEIA